MAKSKLESWFEIARVSNHPKGNLTKEVLTQVAENFNPQLHEPPITLGHVTKDHNEKPAMGWIDGVKVVGDRLLAKGSQIWNQFDGMVRDGRFKKRSIGLRFNAEKKPFLHHLAFLGATSPAVKGMPNLYSDNFNFSDDFEESAENYDFNDNNFNQPKPGVKTMDYSETQIADMKAKATADATKAAEVKAATDYAEKLKTETKTATDAAEEKMKKEYSEKADAEKKKAGHYSEADKFIDEGLKVKFITPAMVKGGLKSLLYSMAEPVEITYSEEDKDGAKKEIKADSYSVLKGILRNFAEAPEKEINGPDPGKKPGDANFSDDEGTDYAEESKRANELISEAKKAGDPISYSDALIQARDERKTKK